MLQVKKSQIGDEGEFARQVEEHARELTDWTAHMAKVGVDPEYVAHPRPQAHRLVEMAIGEDGGTFRSSYEVLDDSPKPEEVLLAKKAKLFGLVSGLEQAASNATYPFGKRRLASIRASEIALADAKRRDEFIESHQKKRLAEFESLKRVNPGVSDSRVEGKLSPPISEVDVNQHVFQTRDPDDAQFLSAHEERAKRLAAVVHHAAVLQDQIEDLTLDNVDDWKPAPFPT